jgi:hypothetical protein
MTAAIARRSPSTAPRSLARPGSSSSKISGCLELQLVEREMCGILFFIDHFSGITVY